MRSMTRLSGYIAFDTLELDGNTNVHIHVGRLFNHNYLPLTKQETVIFITNICCNYTSSTSMLIGFKFLHKFEPQNKSFKKNHICGNNLTYSNGKLIIECDTEFSNRLLFYFSI